MADDQTTTPAPGAATCAMRSRAHGACSPRLSPEVEAGVEAILLGIQVVSASVELMLVKSQRPAGSSTFWQSRLARHAVVLVAIRRHPDRTPTTNDLVRIGLPEAAAVTTDPEMAVIAQRLGLTAE